MRDLAQAIRQTQPETVGERLTTALVQLSPPKPWRPIGWLARAAGTSRQRLESYLSDKVQPKLTMVEKLALILNCSPGWIAFGIPPVAFTNPRLGRTGLARPRPRMPEVKARTTVYRCSRCHRRGHNRTTCD